LKNFLKKISFCAVLEEFLGKDIEGVVKVLIAKGANVNDKTKKGETALSLARRGRHEEVVELLLKHGAKE